MSGSLLMVVSDLDLLRTIPRNSDEYENGIAAPPSSEPHHSHKPRPKKGGHINEYRADGTRRFGVGHFDLVVIDEAHRSVYRKYRGTFDCFDSLLVGLTATPQDEVDKNTYDLFDLETGVPTDAYSLDDAIKDGFLVPPQGVSVQLEFVREGIVYDELSEDEKDEWDELDWGEDDEGSPLDPPDEVDAAELNKWLFNDDTVDRALQHLMAEGIKVAGGDFVNLVIDYLTEHGTIDPGRVYESPFTDVAPQGPNAIFPAPDLDEFFNIVQHLHDTAAE